jgi:hypothetical protein
MRLISYAPHPLPRREPITRAGTFRSVVRSCRRVVWIGGKCRLISELAIFIAAELASERAQAKEDLEKVRLICGADCNAIDSAIVY